MQDTATDFYDLADKILTEDLVLVISIAVIIVALILGWLLLRGPRLWYWKVNQKAGILKKIDSRLKHVENYLNIDSINNAIMQEKMDRVFTGKSLKPEGCEEAKNKAFGDISANETVDGKHNAKSVSDAAEQEKKSDESKAVLEAEEYKAWQEAERLAEDKAQQEAKRLAEYKIETYVGKSGKIYREDELEALIKD